MGLVTWNAHVRILTLYRRGLTDEQISEQSGYAVEEIIEWRCEYGYQKNRNKKEPVENKRQNQVDESASEPHRKRSPCVSLRKGEQRGRYHY